VTFFTFLRLTPKSTPATKERCSAGVDVRISQKPVSTFPAAAPRPLELPIYVLLPLVFGCLAAGMAGDDWPG
jgi:hypothetical protein